MDFIGPGCRRGHVLLVAGDVAVRRRVVELDPGVNLGALAMVPAGVLLGSDVPADMVALDGVRDPNTVLTRLRSAAAAPGPLLVYLSGRLTADRRGRCLYFALAGTVSSAVRYTAVPWEWLGGVLAGRPAGSTTVWVDLVADREAWPLLGEYGGLPPVASGVDVYGVVCPPGSVAGGGGVSGYTRQWIDQLRRAPVRPADVQVHVLAVGAAGLPSGALVVPTARELGMRPAPGQQHPYGQPPHRPAQQPLNGQQQEALPQQRSPHEPQARAQRLPQDPQPLPLMRLSQESQPLWQQHPQSLLQPSPVQEQQQRQPLAEERQSVQRPHEPLHEQLEPDRDRGGSDGPGMDQVGLDRLDSDGLGPDRLGPDGFAPDGFGSGRLGVGRLVLDSRPGQGGPERGELAVPGGGWLPGGGGDPRPYIHWLASGGRHGEAASLARVWEEYAGGLYGGSSVEAVQWTEIRADLARMAGDFLVATGLWAGACRVRVECQGVAAPEVYAAAAGALYCWTQVRERAAVVESGPGLVALLRVLPGMDQGHLRSAQARLDALGVDGLSRAVRG
ncbi:hypothetical protein OG753_39515 [Streptomyces sp. NBC_00029]|uniref:hypothetical protein n=1 Tax=Streptomyces sp. NBC_00029 TaxID=2903613 RepID=UPI003255F338